MERDHNMYSITEYNSLKTTIGRVELAAAYPKGTSMSHAVLSPGSGKLQLTSPKSLRDLLGVPQPATQLKYKAPVQAKR